MATPRAASAAPVLVLRPTARHPHPPSSTAWSVPPFVVFPVPPLPPLPGPASPPPAPLSVSVHLPEMQTRGGLHTGLQSHCPVAGLHASPLLHVTFWQLETQPPALSSHF